MQREIFRLIKDTLKVTAYSPRPLSFQEVMNHWRTFSVWSEEGTMTVGEAVSTEDDFTGLDSSMERDAMAPGAGASDDGIPVGGCCFFLIMSL